MKKQKIILSGIYSLIGFILAFLLFNFLNQSLIDSKEERYYAKPPEGNYLSFVTESGDKFDITPPLADRLYGQCEEIKDLDDTFITFSLDNFLSKKNINKFAVYPFLWESKDGRIGFLYE